MEMREKMIELLTAPISITESTLGEEATPKMQMGRIFAENLADHLIANEVTIPVRCRDCEYRRGDFFGGFVCRLHKGLAMVTDESFCSYGERRTDEGKAD